MSNFNPAPTDEAIQLARQRWKGRTDTFGRVYYTILGVDEFTHYPEIAETADCSPNSAKKHLNRLVHMGLVRRDPTVSLARYRRNEAYFEWYEASRLADELTEEELIDRVRQLEGREEELKQQFDADNPSAVSAFGQRDHEKIHDRMEAIGEWKRIKRDLQLYEFAHLLATNDGHLLPR